MNGCSLLSAVSSRRSHRYFVYWNHVRLRIMRIACKAFPENEVAMGALRRQSHSLSPTPEWVRIGRCVVNVPLREIQPPGGRSSIRITPKAMGVLLALVEANGRPVSRDALLERVWPNTLPTGDVVTQAIVQLRKGFTDESLAPYIATINRTGYRLTAAAEWFEAAPSSPKLPLQEDWSSPKAVIDHQGQREPIETGTTPDKRSTGMSSSLLGGLVMAVLLAVAAYMASQTSIS